MKRAYFGPVLLLLAAGCAGSSRSEWTTSLAYSPDGGRLAHTTSEGRLRLSDVKDVGDVRAVRLALGPDPNEILLITPKDEVILWNPSARATIWNSGSLADCPWVLAVSRDGSRWAVGSRSGRVTLWDAATRAVFVSIGGSELIQTLTFSPDGTRLAVGVTSGLTEYRVADGEALWRVESRSMGFRAVAYSPDGSSLAGVESPQVSVWNTASRARKASLTTSHSFTGGIAWTPDGAHLAVSVHQTHHGKMLFSPCHGNYTYSTGWIELWDYRAGNFVERSETFSDSTSDIAIHPDGRSVAYEGFNVWRPRILRK